MKEREIEGSVVLCVNDLEEGKRMRKRKGGRNVERPFTGKSLEKDGGRRRNVGGEYT